MLDARRDTAEQVERRSLLAVRREAAGHGRFRGLDHRFLLLVPERWLRHGLSGESLQLAPAIFQPRGEV